jgi:hypothetical protein
LHGSRIFPENSAINRNPDNFDLVRDNQGKEEASEPPVMITSGDVCVNCMLLYERAYILYDIHSVGSNRVEEKAAMT